jgi:tetratricopeptide (TPR) repeat protein
MEQIAKDFFKEDYVGDAEDIARSIQLLQMDLERFVNQHAEEDLQMASKEVQQEAGILLYTLGKDFYLLEDYSTAAQYFETGLAFDLDVRDTYVEEMVVGYGLSLINSGQGREGIVLDAVYDEFCDRSDYCFMMGLVYMEQHQYEQAVVEFARATTLPAGKIEGACGARAYYYAGECRRRQNRPEEAGQFFEKAQKARDLK